jgi:hypothetical protein
VYLILDDVLRIDEDFCPGFRQYLSAEENCSIAELLSKLDEATDDIHQDSSISETLKDGLKAFLVLRKNKLLFFKLFEELVQGAVTESTQLLRNKKESNPPQPLNATEIQLSSSITVLSKIHEIVGLNESLSSSVGNCKEVILRFFELNQLNESDFLVPIEASYCKDFLPKLILNGPKRVIDEGDFSTRMDQSLSLHKQFLEVYEFFILTFLVKPEGTAVEVFPLIKISLSFEELFSLCCDVSSKKFHLIPRAYYVSFLYILAIHLEKFLLNSALKSHIPEKLFLINNSAFEWLKTSPAFASWELLKLTAINRNRMFARLENVFQLWGNVVTESLYLDEQINEEILKSPKNSELTLSTDLSASGNSLSMYWFATWAVLHSTSLMDLFMKLMVEMSIIDLKEFDYFYWYWDYIYSTHNHAVDKMKSQIVQLRMKSATTPERKDEFTKFVNELSTQNDCYHRSCGQICRGTFRFIIACKQLNLILENGFLQDSNQFTSVANVFASRFKIFQEIINPTPLSYHEYAATVAKDLAELASKVPKDNPKSRNASFVNSLQILHSALICFQSAKTVLDEGRKAEPNDLRLVELVKVSFPFAVV